MGTGLFASALGGALADWMRQEGETAAQLPDIRSKVEALRQSKSAFPLEQEGRELQNAATRQRTAFEKELQPGAKTLQQADIAGRLRDLKKPEFYQMPDGSQAQWDAATGSFKIVPGQPKDPRVGLAQNQLDEAVQAAKIDEKTRALMAQGLAKLRAGGKQPSATDLANLAVESAVSAGNLKDIQPLLTALSGVAHYTQPAIPKPMNALDEARAYAVRRNADAAMRRAIAMESTASSLADLRKRNTPGPDGLTAAQRQKAAKDADIEARRTLNLMPGQEVPPEMYDLYLKRSKEAYNRYLAAARNEEAQDPVAKILQSIWDKMQGMDSEDSKTATTDDTEGD